MLPRLHEPIGGVLGTHVPVIADTEDFVLHVPGWRAGLLVLLYGITLVLAGRAAGSRHASVLLFAAAALALLAFPFPVRAAPHTVRFLTPLYLPVAALVGLGRRPRGTSRRAWVVVLALAALHLAGATQLLEAWRTSIARRAPFLAARPAPGAAACSTRTACGTRTPRTARRSGSRGRAASGCSRRRRGTIASATGRCRCSTRCASRRTSPGS